MILCDSSCRSCKVRVLLIRIVQSNRLDKVHLVWMDRGEEKCETIGGGGRN